MAQGRWARAAAGFAGLRLVGQGAEFVAFVLFARHLGPDGFGRFWLAFLAARYLGLVGDWGASIRGARDVAGAVGADLHLALVRRREVASSVLAVGFVAATLAIGHPDLAWLALCVAGRGMNRDWMSLGAADGARAGLPAAVQGLALVILATVARGVLDPAAAVGAAYALGLVVSRHLNPLPHGSATAERVRVNGWGLSAAIADQVSLSADSFLLALLLSTMAAGVYGAVYRLPNAASTVLGLVITVVTAGITEAVARDPMSRGALRRRSLRTSALAGMAVFALAPVAVLLVEPVFGAEFRAGRSAAGILTVALGLVCAGAPLHSLVLADHRDRDYAVGLMSAAALNVLLNLVLIPHWELTGAALATLGSVLFLQLHLYRCARRIEREGAAPSRPS